MSTRWKKNSTTLRQDQDMIRIQTTARFTRPDEVNKTMTRPVSKRLKKIIKIRKQTFK
jgi:hypothetical protein